MGIETAIAKIKREEIDTVIADIAEASDTIDASHTVDNAQENLRGGLVAASLLRLIPALIDLGANGGGQTADGCIRVDDDGKELSAVVRDADGVPRYRATVKRETPDDDKDTALRFNLVTIDPSTGESSWPVLAGGVMDYGDGDRLFAFGNARRYCRIGDWFQFADMIAESLPLPEVDHGRRRIHLGRCFYAKELMAVVDADGGISRERGRDLVAAQDAAIEIARAPRLAETLKDLHDGLLEAGFDWGKLYAAYADTDIRCFPFKVPGGIALFQENIDLMSSHRSFVAMSAVDENGKPTTFGFWALNSDGPDADSPAKLIEAMITGNGVVPTATVQVDLETKELHMADPFDDTGIGSYITHAFEGIASMLVDRKSEEERWGYEERTDFGAFEPGARNEWDEEDDEDDGFDSSAPSP